MNVGEILFCTDEVEYRKMIFFAEDSINSFFFPG